MKQFVTSQFQWIRNPGAASLGDSGPKSLIRLQLRFSHPYGYVSIWVWSGPQSSEAWLSLEDLLLNSLTWLMSRDFSFLACGSLKRAASNTAADFPRNKWPKRQRQHTHTQKHTHDDSSSVLYNLIFEVAYNFLQTYQPWWERIILECKYTEVGIFRSCSYWRELKVPKEWTGFA